MASTSGIDFTISVPDVYIESERKANEPWVVIHGKSLKQSVWDAITAKTDDHMSEQYTRSVIPEQVNGFVYADLFNSERPGRYIFILQLTRNGLLEFKYIYAGGPPTDKDKEAAAFMKTAVQEVIATSGSATGMMTEPAIPPAVAAAQKKLPPELLGLITASVGERERENPFKKMANAQDKPWYAIWRGGRRTRRKAGRHVKKQKKDRKTRTRKDQRAHK